MNPLRAPISIGVNDTPIVQVAPTAYDGAVQFFVIPKSLAFVPPVTMEVMCSGPVPELASVMT
jgi:hypothetical protein